MESAAESSHGAPASGGWELGHGAGGRKFFDLGRPFALEYGSILDGVVLAYETWGELVGDGSNAVLIFHALSGDSHVCGEASPPSHMSAGWWNGMVGAGAAIDTDSHFVVCANFLGGCQGSTGPMSRMPDSTLRYGPDFPTVTIRDVVRSQKMLGDYLGVSRWKCVIGGSMGGMAALEYGIMYPGSVRSLVVLASTGAASSQQIAWSKVGRQAILDDAGFCGGRYYESETGCGPHLGLANARRIGMIHYRSSEELDRRFGRNKSGRVGSTAFDVESYLDHQAQKFVRRFDANSYLVLNRMMDLHDIGRGRGGIERALSRVKAPTAVFSISSDSLYPRSQQERIVSGLSSSGAEVCHTDIISDNGHDGFLTECGQISPHIIRFLDNVGS